MSQRFMESLLSLCARIGTMNLPRAVARRDSVLDCGKTEQQIGMCACAPRPLPLLLARAGWESARGLAQSKPVGRSIGSWKEARREVAFWIHREWALPVA